MKKTRKKTRRKRWKVPAKNTAPIRYLVVVAVTQGGMDDAETVYKMIVSKDTARAVLRRLGLRP